MANSLNNFPDFLLKYKEKIVKGSMETVHIEAVPLSKGETTLLTQSKFRGKPYLPANMKYPVDSKGKPMLLYAQINFAEIPHLKDYPQSGILQYFHKAPFYESDPDDGIVLFHKDINQEAMTDFSFIGEHIDDNCPIQCEQKLLFTQSIEYGGSIFDPLTNIIFYENEPDEGDEINNIKYNEFSDSLTDGQRDVFDNFFNAHGHKIGGLGEFPNHYRDLEYNKNHENDDLILLQIDSNINLGMYDDDSNIINWGDCGVAHIFIRRHDLTNLNFEKVIFSGHVHDIYNEVLH